MKINFHLIRRHINHFFHAGYWRGHHVHSPFVYNLVRHVITTRKKDRVLRNAVRKYRKQMLENRSYIELTDFGTGSNRLTTVRRLAQHAAVSERYGMLLARMVKEYQPSNIIELGTSLGIGTCYMALARPESTVHTIEGCPNSSKVAADGLRRHAARNVQMHTGNFNDVLPQLLQTVSPDFVFVDGNHTHDATLRYFGLVAEKSTPRTIIVFDDIHWSDGMTQAWRTIAADSRVMTSVELSRFGIVFFRTGCQKEHYRVRW